MNLPASMILFRLVSGVGSNGPTVSRVCLCEVCLYGVCLADIFPCINPREASRFDTSAAIVDFSYTSGLMKQQQNYSHCTSTAPSPAVRGTESERSAVLTQCLYPQWVRCSRSWFWIPPVELEMLSWTFKALMSSISERPLLICLHEWRK